MRVEYDPRNMAGMSAIGIAEFTAGQPEELATLVCQFVHEGQSYGLMAVPLLHGPVLKAMPKVKRDGMLKAAADAAREVAKGTPEPIHWWLAVRFALYGFVPRPDYVKATLALNSSFNALPNVEQRNDVLIWQPSMNRRADELVERLGKSANATLPRSRARAPSDEWLDLDRPFWRRS